MNITFRAGWVLTLACCLSATSWLSAQSVEESLRRADTQFNLYAYNTALNSYNEVLKTDPNNAYAIARKGDCYFQLNRPADALPWYDRAATMGRVEPDVLFRYGQALMMSGDYIGAKKWFNYYGESNAATGQHYAAMCDFAMQQTTSPFVIKNEQVNTATADYCPVFYGNRVIFSSARLDIARKSKKTDVGSATNELFITQRNPENDLLQRPGFLLTDIQKSPAFNEGPVAYSGGGSRVAFCHNQFVDGTRQIAEKGVEMSLYIAEVNADGKWASPRPFPFNASEYAVGFPWLSQDGNTIYFASNMPGGMGGWDIYSSTWQSVTNMWTSPRNLGATVNTPGNELTPFFDGDDFYFASDWHNGYGGMDIFKAESQGSYFTNISNLGSGVNSSRDDYAFIFDGASNIGYFTSNRAEGKGNEDIWQVTKGLDEFTILVRDQNQNPIPYADIDFSACGAGTLQTDVNGRYAFAVASGKANCTATVRKAGYPDALTTINSAKERNIVVVLGGAPSFTNSGTTPATYSTATTNEVLGSVVDILAHDPIYSVKVSAQPLPNGVPLVTYTSYSGTYTLNMEPYRQYYLTFSKEGYADAAVNFTTGAVGAQNTVTQVQMSALNLSAAFVPEPTLPTPVKPKTYSEQPQTGTTFTPLGGMTAQPVTTPNPTLTNTVNGYAIQLAAHPANEIPLSKIEKLDNLREYGNLYTKPEGNMSKVRLGVYSSKSEAESVLKKVKKTQKDAFVVEEKDADPTLVLNSSAPAEYDLLAAKKGNTTAPAPVKPMNPGIRFAVQVGSFSIANPLVINSFSNLSDVGNIYTRPENEMMRVRVGVWESQYDAEGAQAVIMAKGYQEAIVVVEKSGTEVPVVLPGQFVPQIQTPATTPQTTPATTPQTTPGTTKQQIVPKSAAAAPASAGDLPALDAPLVYSTTTDAKSGKMLAIGTSAAVLPPAVPVASNEQIMIRICSLTSEPSTFDVKRAEKAGGKVDARISPGGATIMILTGFATEAEALVANEKLHTLGFKDAFVVKELNKDGILRRVSE